MKKAWIAVVALVLVCASQVSGVVALLNNEPTLTAESGGSTLPPLPTGQSLPVNPPRI